MQIVIIGTGNTATVMGKLIHAAGHHIVQVVGRNADQAGQLAAQLDADHTTELYKTDRRADICIIAVSDTAIPQVVSGLPPGRQLVVHTAGAVPAAVLQPSGGHFGVLYPLQSFRKEINALPAVPLLIDANSPQSFDVLNGFAQSLSPQVQRANDEQRLSLHLAAVVVSNFTNHLYALAASWCRREGVDFRLLLPLITEVAHRLYSFPPEKMQTGPAVRGDERSIQSHLALLEKFPDLKNIYKVLTDSIVSAKNNI